MQHIKATFLLIALTTISGLSQQGNFDYRCKLTGIDSSWHSIVLPSHMYSKVNENLSDIRILGITQEKDSIEVPYILKENTSEYESNTVYSDVINETNIGKRYYFTIENENQNKTNQIELDFYNDNFDWHVKLEGSNNNSTWYTILKNERILSIDNEHINYKYTTLNFSPVKYKYMRISFKSKTEPELYNVSMEHKGQRKDVLKTYDPKTINISNNSEKKLTVIDIELKETVPVSYIKIDIDNNFDYYRPIEIQRLIDSVETPHGKKPYYRDLTEQTLSSLEKKEYHFNYELAKTLQILIYNGDNQELNIGDITIKGNEISLMARFTEAAENYYLYYGNKNVYLPYYDIVNFEYALPEKTIELSVEPEESLTDKTLVEHDNKTDNNYWLWAIMAVIILLIGGFTLKMLNENKG